MGHRHMFSTSQGFETDNDQSWNHLHSEPSFVHLARAGIPENNAVASPVENTSIDAVHFPSNWNSAPRLNAYPHLNYNVGMPHCQPDASSPSHDVFLPPHGAGNFSMVRENYAHHASSSNYGRQTFPGAEGGFPDITMGNERGPYKRKSPSVPAVCERGSTSRYYGAGSSSDSAMSTDIWQEKANPDAHPIAWHGPNFGSSYRSSNLSIGGEGSLRNVRSRAALDLETNLARTHISSNPQQVPYTSNHTNDLFSSAADLMGQNSDASTMEWSHIQPSPADPDNNVFNHAANHFIVGSGNPGASEIEGFHNDLLLGRNPVSQNLQETSTPPTRGVRSSSSYTHRFAPTFRAPSGNLQLGHAATSDDGLQLVTENHSSRHPRPFSAAGWRNTDRNGRSRIFSERYQSFPDEPGLRDRMVSEGLMIVERSALYGSRNMFDHHRDMRLDIDNMSYEELLALEERIGNVSTGLSDDLISKCLMESMYCCPDLFKEEGRCVICLEEYKSMDKVGALRTCEHDFHVDCIRKWLFVKNSCPICKAPALADHMKED